MSLQIVSANEMINEWTLPAVWHKCSVQAMTCLHSSDGMDDTWMRKPSLTVRWLLISPESRRGTSNMALGEVVPIWLSRQLIIKALAIKQFNFLSLAFMYSYLFYIHWVSFSQSFSAEGVMRTMTTEKLLKGMPVLQTQIDTLLEFDVRCSLDLYVFWQNHAASRDRVFLFSFSSQVHPKELNNGIINAAFMLLFKDLVKLFASYNDGIINLLGS